jgi:iron complex outermembrane receptor protein
MPTRFLPSAITTACLLVALSPAAWAQTQEVLVIGSARAQRALDAPFAISSVDAQALRDAGPMVNLSEAMGQVPGMVVNNRNNYAQDLQISSRGFGARAAFGVRGMRLYTDGIPATMPDGQGQAGHFDLAGAQRIEALRGPFSALYGNSSGGVIALFTAPVKAGLAEAAVDVGSFGLRQARLGVASPLGEVLGGALTVRANLSKFEIDGFRPQSAADRQLGNLQLGWDNGSDKLTFQFSDQRQDAQDPLGLDRKQFDVDPYQATPQAIQFNTRKEIDQTQAGLHWRHQFSDSGVLRESAVMLYKGERGVTQWQAIPPCSQVDCTADQRFPNRIKHGGGVVDFDRSYSGGDLRLTWRLGTADVVTGLVSETQEDERRGYENFTGLTITPPTASTSALGVTGNLRRDETNRATTREGFAQFQMPLGAESTGLALTGGLRGGQVKMSTRDHYLSNGDDSGDLDFSYVNPVVGLRWALSPALALHASAARGFESPTLGELAYRPDGAAGFNTNLKGQTSRQFELGAKIRMATLEFDAAAFTADTEDEIGVLSNLNGRSTFQNVGRTRRYGLELGSLWRPASGLKLQAALTLLDATYRDAFASGANTVAAGNQIAGTQRSSAWAQAAWQPGGAVPGELALEWRASAKTAANDTNTEFSPGYAIANLRWSARFNLGTSNALELLARVDNLFDRVYSGSVIVNDGNGRYYETGSPRAGLLSVRWLHRW